MSGPYDASRGATLLEQWATLALRTSGVQRSGPIWCWQKSDPVPWGAQSIVLYAQLPIWCYKSGDPGSWGARSETLQAHIMLAGGRL